MSKIKVIIGVLSLFLLSSCKGIVIWNGMDIIGLILWGVFIVVIAIIIVIIILKEYIKHCVEKRKRQKN